MDHIVEGDIKKQYDAILRIYAGYDETGVWQEYGEMKFLSKNDIPAEWGNPDTIDCTFIFLILRRIKKSHSGYCTFILRDTDKMAVKKSPSLRGLEISNNLHYDIYRLSLAVEGKG
jgi:hypothetical protein